MLAKVPLDFRQQVVRAFFIYMSTTSERNVQTFNNSLFGELRVNQATDGMIWFCLHDVCQSLGLGNASQTKSRLKTEGITTNDTPTQSGIQQMLFINEPNLYRCIFQSRKKEAELFQNWVVEEVLPAIRKSGGYLAARADETPEDIMARALVVAQQTIERSKQRVQMLESENAAITQERNALLPMANYTKDVLQSTSTYTFTQCAKELNFRSATAFLAELKRRGIVFKQSGQYQLTSKFAGNGYTASRTTRYYHADGRPDTSTSTVITEKGRMWLHKLFGTTNA